MIPGQLATSVWGILPREPVRSHELGGKRHPVCVCAKSLQTCPTLCDHRDYYSLPGSSDHGILQAGILEWVVIPFSRGSSQPRDQSHVSCVGRQVLYF